jgi:hypothetical protein
MHHDDITASAFCPDSLLATGAFDGQVFVWSIRFIFVVEVEHLWCRSCKFITKFDVRTVRKLNEESTVQLVIPTMLGTRVAIDCLLWLPARLKAGLPNTGSSLSLSVV